MPFTGDLMFLSGLFDSEPAFLAEVLTSEPRSLVTILFNGDPMFLGELFLSGLLASEPMILVYSFVALVPNLLPRLLLGLK